jgi:hypothetical protein
MRFISKITALTLTAALCGIIILSSCGANEANNTGETTTAADVTTAPGETTAQGRENTPDSLPADLDFGGVTLNVFYFGWEESAKLDAVGELSGDIVYDAVYNRNTMVEDRLNVKFNWIKGSDDWSGYPDAIAKSVLANVSDYDFCLLENSQAFKLSLEGYMIDLIDAPYIDYDQPWWYVDFMEQGAIDSSARYFITGDFDMTTLTGASTVYFNKPLYIDRWGDVQTLYDTVLDGNWTCDEFMRYGRDFYTDLNGNGAADLDDLYAFRYTNTPHVPNYWSMSCGLPFSGRDENGLPVPMLGDENAVKWSETLYTLLHSDNLSIVDDAAVTAFINEKSLFYFLTLNAALNDVRKTEFEYGILPYPKLSENLDYVGAAATVNGMAEVVLITIDQGKFDAVCASIEALCAQSYRTVAPALFDVALKVKYAEAQQDAQMIDLIYDSISTSFIMLADKLISTGSIFHTGVMSAKSADSYATYYAKNEVAILTRWNNMIEKYQLLKDAA